MLKYRGGKTKEIPRIMEHVPRFSGRYIEPFVGGGALYFFLEPESAVINDINPRLMAFYAGVRDHYDELRSELDEIEHIYGSNRTAFCALKERFPADRVADRNEELYYSIRDMYNGLAPSAYSDALLYFFINKVAYSGMIRYNSKGEFNVPYGRYPNFNTHLVSLRHSELLKRSELYNGDYSRVFEICDADDFVFLDPPYDCVFSDYGNTEYRDGFAEDDHRRLAADFANLPCMALMVIGRTPLTEELYGQYIVDEYSKNYSVNIRNRFKSAASHIVVANYRRKWSANRVHSESYAVPAESMQFCLFEAEMPYGNNQ